MKELYLDGKDFRGTELVEAPWKNTTGIINWRMNTEVRYHDSLHGFQKGSRTGTATLKAKLLHKMTVTREAVLHTIFMDIQKVYDALDRYRCLKIL